MNSNHKENDVSGRNSRDANEEKGQLSVKRSYPTSSLSASESEEVEVEEFSSEDEDMRGKRVKSETLVESEIIQRPKTPIFGSKAVDRSEDSTSASTSSSASVPYPVTSSKNNDQNGEDTISLPVMKIQSVLGGQSVMFPIHPRLTLIDLKDFILFHLNIPHPQQVLTFRSAEGAQMTQVTLSNFSESALLCTIPGLIDEVTGRCAPVALSFKMSSGMDMSYFPPDVDSNDLSGSDEGFFEINTAENSNDPASPIASLASTLTSMITLPLGTPPSSKVLIRSVSKGSTSNNNMPTLWEVYLPESGIKLLVTAIINFSNEEKEKDKDVQVTPVIEEEVDGPVVKSLLENVSDSEIEAPESDAKKAPVPVPVILISPESKTSIQEEIVLSKFDSLHVSSPSPVLSDLKPFCTKCHVRCRPALRFICKCSQTFCQVHRYPDQHACTFDHRAAGLATIQANNPKIVKDKVENF